MNIISIDYGIKYIGLAFGNLNTLKIIKLNIFNNSKFFFFFFKKNISILSPKLIIIGFPSFFKKNSISYINLIFLIKKFFFKIINIYNIKIKLIDEFFTSLKFSKSDNISALYLINKYFESKVVGFEPTILKNISGFKSDAINHSAIPSL